MYPLESYLKWPFVCLNHLLPPLQNELQGYFKGNAYWWRDSWDPLVVVQNCHKDDAVKCLMFHSWMLHRGTPTFYLTRGTQEPSASDRLHWCGLLFIINRSPFQCCLPKLGVFVYKTSHRKYGPQVVVLTQFIPYFMVETVTLVFYLVALARRWTQPLQWHLFQRFINAMFVNVFFPKVLSHLQKFKQESASLKIPFHELAWKPFLCQSSLIK